MQVNIWYNKEMNLWRWTMIDPELNMFSGQQKELQDTLKEIQKTVETNQDK